MLSKSVHDLPRYFVGDRESPAIAPKSDTKSAVGGELGTLELLDRNDCRAALVLMFLFEEMVGKGLMLYPRELS